MKNEKEEKRGILREFTHMQHYTTYTYNNFRSGRNFENATFIISSRCCWGGGERKTTVQNVCDSKKQLWPTLNLNVQATADSVIIEISRMVVHPSVPLTFTRCPHNRGDILTTPDTIIELKRQ